MQSFIHSDIFIFLATVIVAIFTILLGVILFYTIVILRIIYEVVVLARKQMNGFSLKMSDMKRYMGGMTAVRILTYFFRKKGKKLS
jgi:hypothetical protein